MYTVTWKLYERVPHTVPSLKTGEPITTIREYHVHTCDDDFTSMAECTFNFHRYKQIVGLPDDYVVRYIVSDDIDRSADETSDSDTDDDDTDKSAGVETTTPQFKWRLYRVYEPEAYEDELTQRLIKESKKTFIKYANCRGHYFRKIYGKPKKRYPTLLNVEIVTEDAP